VADAGIKPSSVAAIAIDGQMAGIIGVGRDGRAVTPYDSWLDTRCAPFIDRMSSEAGARILEKTGCAPSFNHGPKILWWMHERPEVFREVRSFVQPGGYAGMRLCGREGDRAYIDETYLHFSGFADNNGSRWDDVLCGAFDLDPAKLPEIVSPSAVVGQLIPAMAQRCGLPSGVPVVAGCGDTTASFLSCGATREGLCVDVAGTASVFASTTAAFNPDIDRRTLGCGRSAVPGLWHPYAYINGGGMNLEWYRREIANRGAAEGSDLMSLKELDKKAEGIGGAGTIPLFVPHLAGRVSPAMPYLRGAWVGLDWTHGLAHLYRGVLEGVALEYGVYLGVLRGLYPELALREIRVTGGGGASPLWNRIKASVLQMPVVRLRGSPGAPSGSALLAGFGIGLFDDLDRAADRWTQAEATFRPEPEWVPLYREKVRRYEALLNTLNAFSEGDT
jgi:xylulokinase